MLIILSGNFTAKTASDDRYHRMSYHQDDKRVYNSYRTHIGLIYCIPVYFLVRNRPKAPVESLSLVPVDTRANKVGLNEFDENAGGSEVSTEACTLVGCRVQGSGFSGGQEARGQLPQRTELFSLLIASCRRDEGSPRLRRARTPFVLARILARRCLHVGVGKQS